MNKRIQAKPQRTRAKQQKAARLWPTYILMFVCGLLLVSGFFFAGRQHFSTMDYGMKNSRLRKQVDDLEAEKRRLMLAREVSLSPAEIKRAAKKTGLTDMAAVEGEVTQIASATSEKVVPPTAEPLKSMIIKTASVSASAPRVAAVYAKTEKPERQGKRTVFAE